MDPCLPTKLYININLHIIHIKYFFGLETDNSFTDKTQGNISKKNQFFFNIKTSSYFLFKNRETKKI